jgi:hypothetical protein
MNNDALKHDLFKTTTSTCRRGLTVTVVESPPKVPGSIPGAALFQCQDRSQGSRTGAGPVGQPAGQSPWATPGNHGRCATTRLANHPGQPPNLGNWVGTRPDHPHQGITRITSCKFIHCHAVRARASGVPTKKLVHSAEKFSFGHTSEHNLTCWSDCA